MKIFTFEKYLEQKILNEQDQPAPDLGGDPMGGGLPPSPGGDPLGGTAPPPGGDPLGGLGGGGMPPPMGGGGMPPIGGFSPGATTTGKAPMKLKAVNVWDVLEELL